MLQKGSLEVLSSEVEGTQSSVFEVLGLLASVCWQGPTGSLHPVGDVQPASDGHHLRLLIPKSDSVSRMRASAICTCRVTNPDTHSLSG